MTAWLRLPMLWLLALAIPAQGFAAAAMVHCDQSHQRMHRALAQAQAQHADNGQHPRGHSLAATGLGVESAHAVQHLGTHAPDKLTDLGHYKCGACGACCSSVAMPGFALNLPETTPIVQWKLVRFQGHTGFITGGPDRPPRPSFA